MEAAYKYRLWLNISGATRVATERDYQWPAGLGMHPSACKSAKQNKKPSRCMASVPLNTAPVFVLKSTSNSDWTGQDWLNAKCLQRVFSSSENHTGQPHGRKDARLWGADGFILRILTFQQAEVGPGYLSHDQEHHMCEERCWNWTLEGLISSLGKNQG